MQRSEEGPGHAGTSPLTPEGPASRPAFCSSSPARVGSGRLQRPGFSAPGGAAPAPAAPGLGGKGGQLRSHLLRQPQQPDHPVAPTEPNVSTVRGQGARPQPAQLGPSPAALGGQASGSGGVWPCRAAGSPNLGKESMGDCCRASCLRVMLCCLRYEVIYFLCLLYRDSRTAGQRLLYFLDLSVVCMVMTALPSSSALTAKLSL